MAGFRRILSSRAITRTAAFIVSAGAAIALSLTAAHANPTSSSSPQQEAIAAVQCGSWGQRNSGDATAAQFSQRFGAIQSCGFTGGLWAMSMAGTSSAATTNGSTPSALQASVATVAVFACANPTAPCASPTTPHPFSDWKTVAAPGSGLLKLIGNPYPGEVIFDLGGSQVYLNLHTLKWEWSVGPVFGQCATEWGKAGGSPTAAPSSQDSFLRKHAECVGSQ